MIFFELESPEFESHTDILSLSLSLLSFFLYCFYYYCETTDTADENLICDYIICDRPFSHMGQEYPILWLSGIFLSQPACLILGQNGYLISCCGNINKRMMCEAKSGTRLNKSENLPEISLFRPQHNHRFYLDQLAKPTFVPATLSLQNRVKDR